MKRHLLLLCTPLLLLTAVCCLSCSKDEVISSGPAEVLYQTDVLEVDLNKIAQPSIICVVNSQTGLKSIEKYIVAENEDGTEYDTRLGTPVTSFYNKYSYSINEMVSFTENMLRFKLVITDLGGRVTVSEQPFSIIPLFGLPDVYFSSDEAGEVVITSLQYLEEDPIPDIYVQVSGEEDLQYVIISQSSGSINTTIKTVNFEPRTKRAALKISEWNDGTGYEFESDVTALRALVAGGEMLKTRETVLSVEYRELMTLQFDQDKNIFNGLPADEEAILSGEVTSFHPINRFVYVFKHRDGTAEPPVQIPVENEKFSIPFTPANTLSAIEVTLENSGGKTITVTFEVHVGYKYYHLLASADQGNACFFSSELGRLFDAATGKLVSESIDIGFVTQNSGAQLRMVGVKNSKFDSGSNITTDWAHRNDPRFFTSPLVTPASFDAMGIDEIRNVDLDALTSALFVNLATTFSTTPSAAAGLYERFTAGGVSKKVFVAFEKIEVYSGNNGNISTFWIKVKAEV